VYKTGLIKQFTKGIHENLLLALSFIERKRKESKELTAEIKTFHKEAGLLTDAIPSLLVSRQ